ncbi:hypothetical protein PGB90_007335 [Kerria lacca]
MYISVVRVSGYVHVCVYVCARVLISANSSSPLLESGCPYFSTTVRSCAFLWYEIGSLIATKRSNKTVAFFFPFFLFGALFFFNFARSVA